MHFNFGAVLIIASATLAHAIPLSEYTADASGLDLVTREVVPGVHHPQPASFPEARDYVDDGSDDDGSEDPADPVPVDDGDNDDNNDDPTDGGDDNGDDGDDGDDSLTLSRREIVPGVHHPQPATFVKRAANATADANAKKAPSKLLLQLCDANACKGKCAVYELETLQTGSCFTMDKSIGPEPSFKSIKLLNPANAKETLNTFVGQNCKQFAQIPKENQCFDVNPAGNSFKVQ